jgi:hypothetical protein
MSPKSLSQEPLSIFIVALLVFVGSRGFLQTTLSLEFFCDSLIREQDKLLQPGVISAIGTSEKTLVAQQRDKSKQPKKKHPCNNKQCKGPKPS